MERLSRPLPLACLLLSLAPLTQAAEAPIDCAALDTKANAEAGSWRPPIEGTVIGQGRVYFHSAPNSACLDKKVFIIPGDSVTIYASTQDDWAQVMYVAKGGKDFTGWIEESRLKLGDHLGGNLEPDDAAENMPEDTPGQ
ncbi:SH3 domain-containing protein [Pseudomonas vanderleydeniana]|uniref:SH3 domain-containing protein n=1 Tax=Pseudomonas vanderleydeniana TaxID=2745495 RepID=A0A9E6PPW5_9PSED|nr:SH3 domain-containing protein [Pseudomonas vanderleydeniana]QXI30408.1 SH3 domain-containing protein [Pseudomonas vanderleydeniana]